MNSRTSSVLTALIAICAIQATVADEEMPMLKAGDEAPAFSLPGSDGNTHSLEDYLGKKAVVLAWFPKAFTGG
jgi:peroxiredoxin